MSTSPHKTIDERLREWTGVDRAMRAGLRDALLRHKRLGQSIVVWRDGRVVEIPPEQINVGEAPDVSSGAEPSSPEAA